MNEKANVMQRHNRPIAASRDRRVFFRIAAKSQPCGPRLTKFLPSTSKKMSARRRSSMLIRRFDTALFVALLAKPGLTQGPPAGTDHLPAKSYESLCKAAREKLNHDGDLPSFPIASVVKLESVPSHVLRGLPVDPSSLSSFTLEVHGVTIAGKSLMVVAYSVDLLPRWSLEIWSAGFEKRLLQFAEEGESTNYWLDELVGVPVILQRHTVFQAGIDEITLYGFNPDITTFRFCYLAGAERSYEIKR